MGFRKKEPIEPMMESVPRAPPEEIQAVEQEEVMKTYLLDVTDNEEFDESFVIVAESIVQAIQKFTLKAIELDFSELSIDIQLVDVIQ